MACRVVCISHATGAGGEEVGRLVAERLGFLYVNVVIVAHAASHAVGPGHEALRVLVTGSPTTRAGRVGERTVKDADAARRDYLKRFYGVDEELPTHYDLVVNTDVLSVERAADLIAQAGTT